MKKYTIKPEYIYLYGEGADADTVITEDEVVILSSEWDMPVDEILEQLTEYDD